MAHFDWNDGSRIIGTMAQPYRTAGSFDRGLFSETKEKRTILVKDFDNLYIICGNKKENTLEEDKHFIYTRNKREIEIILGILGVNVSVYEPDVQSEEILEWLKCKTYIDILPDLMLTGRESQEVIKCFNKIGIHPIIKQKLNSKAYMDKLSKEYVHKTLDKNVMLSNFYELENTGLLHMNVFYETGEITLDHCAEDHVEAILLMEICRQAGIVAASVNQDPTRAFIITKEERMYKKFIRRDRTAIMQVLCVAPKIGVGYCVFNLIQDDECCMKGCLIGMSYPNKQSYVKKKE